MRWMKRAPGFAVASVLMVAFVPLVSPGSAPDSSPAALARQRVSLYLEAARKPLDKLAPEIYALATSSERCRLTSGAKACGLLPEPLKASGLKPAFEYYVAGPVEAGLNRQKIEVEKSHWTWHAGSP